MMIRGVALVALLTVSLLAAPLAASTGLQIALPLLVALLVMAGQRACLTADRGVAI